MSELGHYPFDAAGIMPPASESDQTYATLSRRASVAHAADLRDLRQEIEAVYDLPAETTVLAMAEDEHVSGHTSPLHGLISIAPRLFAYPEVARFVGVHEAVHAQLGNSLGAAAIDAVAPGYRRHFHAAIIPAWLRGEVDLTENAEYIDGHYYDGLVPGGWQGPTSMTLEATEAALSNYFSLVARDLITKHPGMPLTHSDLFMRRWQSELDAVAPSGPEVYAGREAWLAELMVTGISMGNDMVDYSQRNEISRNDVLTWEEGVANRIAADLTGANLDVVNEVAPQDLPKIFVAEKLKEAGLTGHMLAETVRSYADLHTLLRKHF